MGHSVSEEYLSGENIDKYFEALSRKIQESGIGQHKILVVGGAAMALKYQDGRSTVDIDICFLLLIVNSILYFFLYNASNILSRYRLPHYQHFLYYSL